MKLFTQWRFILLSALFSLLGVGSAWAQLASLEKGKVYHFTNANYSDKALAATYPNSVAGVAADDDNIAQLWYVESKGDNGYALRNLAFGTYLQANGQSSRWTLASTTDADNSWITLATVGSNNAFKGYTFGNYGYAHIDGSSNIVGWETGATSTQWTITQKYMSDEDIQNALNIFTSVPTIQAHLDNLFSDKSCTTLMGAFDENNASYQALPTTLQAMVRKVAGNTTWDEANSDNSKEQWDAKYAKKYRIQLYEPYNEPECAAAALRINAHTNLNNPTGIFANKGDILYVMVEEAIKDGSKLYLSYYKGHDRLSGATDGYELKQGLNVIPVYYDGSNFCVNYVVNTFDTSKGYGSQAKAHRLSDYAPIKIHIEGGYINGYWNKMGDALYTADTDEDWNYIEARATQQDVVVLGKYMTLKFPLLSVHAENQTAMSQIYNEKIKVSESINEWDNIMLWERFVMGLSTKADLDNSTLVSPYSDKKIFEYTGEDYTDYYNVHGLAYSIESSNNPHAGWDYTGYPNNSMVSINADVCTNAGAHWTAGHEIGHQHQGPLNMRGLTEVTNNLFSNVVLWCFGKSTSRYNGTDGSLTNVLQQFNAEGTDFFSNNIWAQTIMYYKLFLYYHVLGHNTQFYPRLYEMLRQNPMIIEGDQDGSKCLMHFYKLCCDAAQEDLTEFFRAHGFFRVMEERFVSDYGNATYNLTQVQIDAAIAEVEAKKYPKNIAVLFINDATGEEILSHKGDPLVLYNETRTCSEIGSYSNFNSDAANYTYSVTGNSITMEGSGGVGFAILNENDELIGFSDKKTFDISAEAVAAIASGKASVVTLNADNTPAAATNVMDTDNTEAKYALLGALLANSRVILNRIDATGTKVGFYRESALEGLQRAYDKAKVVYDAMTVSAYVTAYEVLFQEYVAVMSNDFARVNITDGYAYRLTNKAYSNLSMAVGDGEKMLGLETTESDNQLWYFEPGVTKNTYYLKNKGTGKYPGDVESGQVLSANKSEADKGKNNGAYAYRLQEMQPGVFALVGETGLHCSASQDDIIVGWETDADATQWYITANELNDALEARTKLEELVGKAEALINEVGTVEEQGVEPITLTADAYYCNARCINTQWDQFSSYSVLNDGNIGTYLHTDYSGADSEDGYAHYIRMDVGESSKVQMFKINYTTRNYKYPTAPTSITVEGSNDLTTWEPIETNFTEGLPTNQGTAFTTPTFGNGIKYRYIRLVVNSTITNQEAGPEGNKHRYFALSELGISKVNYTTALNATYNTINSNLLSDLYSGMLEANGTLATSSQADVLNAAYTTLYTTAYKPLLDAKTGVDNTALTAKKTELQKLINNTTTLIDECGTVTFTPGTFDGRAKLQTTDENDRFYIWTNAQELDEGPIANLIDGDFQTYFHSDYSGANSTDGKDHHLTVNLGGVTASSFQFSYTTRHNADANYPKTIKVYGSTDGNNFDDNEVAVITGLTAQNSWTYNSDVITESKEFTHLRFMVTENNNNNNKGGHPIFHMAEFSLTIIGRPEKYSVTLNDNIGIEDEALLVATYKEKEEAVYVKENATTEAQLDKAIADLQAQFDALTEAVYRKELRDKIDELDGLIDQCGEVAYDSDTDTYTATVDPNAGSVTKELLISAAQAKAAAEEVANTSTDQAALIAEKEKLTTHCEALQAAFAIKLYPVTITTDVANPMLYTMKSHRGDTKAVQYLPADGHKFNISDESTGSAVQAYYFTEGTVRGQVYVHPYAAGGMVLAANDTGDGAGKAFATEKGNATYEEWKFVEATVNEVTWYSLQPVGTSTYFSNYGGGSNKMGFYSTADEGSHLQFVSTTVEGTMAYNTLKSYYDGLTLSNITGSDDRVGYYPVTQATDYNEAYNQATSVLNSGGISEEQYIAAYEALKSANEAMTLILPAAGKYYKIVSVSDHDYCNTALAYANENNGAQFSKDMTSTNARAVWEFIPSGDGFHVRNLHTDSHIGTLGWGAAHTLQEETAVVKIESVNGQGLVKLINGQPMHAQNTNSVIVGYPGNLGSASIWSIQEVNINEVTYPLTITQFGYAGLHLNYPVELPDGLTAYTIYSAEGANGIARMRSISGSVIPANTGVIIEGKQGDYNLNYTTYEGNDIDNLLLGSNYTRYVKADDNTDYFVFAAKKQTDGSYKVGLYITWEQYDANGSTDVKDSESQVVDSNKNTHNGGYFKSSANKIYLPYSDKAGAAKFFFQRDNDVTGIDSLLNGLNSHDEVYDLQGRRISKVTKEGIYIVNGQKRYLKATKF